MQMLAVSLGVQRRPAAGANCAGPHLRAGRDAKNVATLRLTTRVQSVRPAKLNRMSDIRTSRLLLHPIDVAEGERIVARTPGVIDCWADDFPFEGDVRGVEAFLQGTAAHGEQRPFGHYRITRLAGGWAVGGVGFKGQPEGGCAEIGYGLSESARGHGYAAEAVAAVLTMAADRGLSKVIADTTLDNIASQRTLIRAGFRLVRADDELNYYEALLADGPSERVDQTGPATEESRDDG